MARWRGCGRTWPTRACAWSSIRATPACRRRATAGLKQPGATMFCASTPTTHLRRPWSRPVSPPPGRTTPTSSSLASSPSRMAGRCPRCRWRGRAAPRCVRWRRSAISRCRTLPGSSSFAANCSRRIHNCAFRSGCAMRTGPFTGSWGWSRAAWSSSTAAGMRIASAPRRSAPLRGASCSTSLPCRTWCSTAWPPTPARRGRARLPTRCTKASGPC